MADEAVSLLKVSLDGELVAEATLVVHDQAGAWQVFTRCFPSFAHLLVGEVYATMQVACDDELRKATESTGLVLELDSKPRSHIVVPQNGHHDLRSLSG